MRAQRSLCRWAPVFAAALVIASCGGGDDSTDSDATTTTIADTEVTEPSAPASASDPTTPAETTASTEPSDADIDSVDEIRPAVVQILAQGALRQIGEEAQAAGGWSGSGFIIDPTGIVVTNNHVVTGAGAVKAVLEDGEEIPARVLGVSECNDLAVLQLTDPGPYAYLEWYDDEIVPGLEVYTAGFPLGEPEFTLTRGIVSKAEADGETSWSSVRHVIEHDAAIQPGNSGGPLVTGDGRVVAVNYRGRNPGTGTVQFMAIAGDLAMPVVDELRNGDAETIGVNGEAFILDDGSAGGVWVSAVEPGTPASETGVIPGDIITELNGIPLSVGTMEPYCDVLRTANPGDPIRIEVYRLDTDELWAGELNGEEMTVRFSFADELGDQVDDGTASAYTYETVTDDSGTIVVSIPAEWSERETSPTELGLSVGPVPSIWASRDLEAFNLTYDEPGMLMFGLTSGASEFGTPADVMGLLAPDDPSCVSEERIPWDDTVFVGELESWVCGSGSIWVAVAANPVAAPDAMAVVGVVARTDADLEALDEILWTFNFA